MEVKIRDDKNSFELLFSTGKRIVISCRCFDVIKYKRGKSSFLRAVRELENLNKEEIKELKNELKTIKSVYIPHYFDSNFDER